MSECLLKELTSLIKMYDVTKIKSIYFGGGGKLFFVSMVTSNLIWLIFFCPKWLDEKSDGTSLPHLFDILSLREI